MGLFDAIGIAGSGLTVHRKWLDALSDNISNANDVTSPSEGAFQQRYVVAQEMAGGGVQVAGVELGSAEGKLVQDPTNPLADAQGYVRRADVDLTSQMTELILAQRGYQANAAVVDRAKESYQAALQIGR